MGNGAKSADLPASYTGTSRIRFGGSVAFATLSAHVRSPEAYSIVDRVYSFGVGKRSVDDRKA
jgi:hypothetical protein